ncbi:hypothetical protein KIW84_021493 [Lathyrus oleraceus]|uniref:Uncharacterized protein n=1 Tax=Pisum sativum TaxID=3888 RepID=A0A9D4YA18_PEA|nr:hypothetical protein KIW84_021493 [Pisum sativum]
MYEALKILRDIDEVIILSKRDNRGNKYDFVRFFNMRDERTLTAKLDNTSIEGRKLFANLPRFKRKDFRMKSSEVMGKGRETEVKHGDHVVQTRGIRDLSKPKDGPPVLLRFFTNEEGLSRFQKAFIGIVENSGLTYRMQDIFHVEGYFPMKVTPLGANLCLLEEQEDGGSMALIKEVSLWLGSLARIIVVSNFGSKEEVVGLIDISDLSEDEEDKRMVFNVSSETTCVISEENVELTEEFSGPWGLSYHEGIKFGEDKVAKLVGPLVMDSEIVGSISFDEVIESKVGVNVEKLHGVTACKTSIVSEDNILGGAVLCYESTMDSDVNQSNSRFWENLESVVGRIVWDSITRLGILIGKENCESVKEVTLMENRDKEEMVKRMAELQPSQ